MHGRADPDPDAAFAAHGRIGRRFDGHDRDFAASQHPPLHRHRRQRQDAAVAADVRQLRQQGVVDRQRGARAVVPHPDQHHARPAVARQIVGEGADVAPDLSSVGGRLLAFHEVGSEVRHQRLELGLRVGRHRRRSSRFVRPTACSISKSVCCAVTPGACPARRRPAAPVALRRPGGARLTGLGGASGRPATGGPTPAEPLGPAAAPFTARPAAGAGRWR